MATMTLYRPVGTAELALIAGMGWRMFPAMPDSFGFYVYPQPPRDPRTWANDLNDPEMIEYIEDGAEDVVRSWSEWGNAPGVVFVLSFEVEEAFWRARPGSEQDVDKINGALVGEIAIYEQYGLG